MKENPEPRARRSIRLKEYDYSQNGAYFVTICTQNKGHVLGEILDGEMRLNGYGEIVSKFWDKIPHYFSNVKTDLHAVMPNHIHGIILIMRDCRGGVSPPPSQGEVTSPLQKRALGQIIAFFKYQTTMTINQIRESPGERVWQRNYWEHVIRNENKLFKIRQYIQNNPLKWHLDRENPERSGTSKLKQEIFAQRQKRNSSKMQPDTWKVKHRAEDFALRSKQGGV